MSRISTVFRPGHKALIGYITVGHPSLDATPDIASALAESGCDIIELGIPFSDPVGDGPTIQHSSFRALQHGATPGACLETAAAIRARLDIPLVFMTYYNLLLNHGLDAFCRDSRNAGIDGLIIPDLPPEEGAELEEAARKHGLDLVYLLAPTSTEPRIIEVTGHATGFVYLVSLTGVTGARTSLPVELEEFVQRVRDRTDLPLCVGFGISTPEQAVRAASAADGVIVGSRFIQLIDEDPSLVLLRSFAGELRNALDNPGEASGAELTYE